LLVTGATVRVVSEAYLGGTPGFTEALEFAFGRVRTLFGASFAAGFVTFVATIALVVPGIVVFCGYSVVPEVASLEPGAGAAGALSRSWSLTRGFKWKALALWLVSFAVLLVVITGIGLLGGAAMEISDVLAVPATIALAALSLLVYPLISCVFTLFYYDLRVRKEAFDLQVLSQQLGVGAM
jgi:hypothetical protein